MFILPIDIFREGLLALPFLFRKGKLRILRLPSVAHDDTVLSDADEFRAKAEALNAPEEVKQLGTFVTKTASEDGLYVAMDQLGLLQGGKDDKK